MEWGSESYSQGTKWLTCNGTNTEHLTNNFQVADVNYNLMRKSNWITETSGLAQSAEEGTRTWSKTS